MMETKTLRGLLNARVQVKFDGRKPGAPDAYPVEVYGRLVTVRPDHIVIVASSGGVSAQTRIVRSRLISIEED